MERMPASAVIVCVMIGIVVLGAGVPMILTLCPPDRIEPILEWYRIIAEAVVSIWRW